MRGGGETNGSQKKVSNIYSKTQLKISFFIKLLQFLPRFLKKKFFCENLSITMGNLKRATLWLDIKDSRAGKIFKNEGKKQWKKAIFEIFLYFKNFTFRSQFE